MTVPASRRTSAPVASASSRLSSTTVSSHISWLTFTATSSSGTSYGTASSTIWGPGALAGKGIKALGEATLRGVENLVIRRRLFAIESFFKSNLPRAGAEVQGLCDEVLELSRVDLYGEKIRARAMRVIINEVDLGDTGCLLKSLAKWPPIEAQLFAAEFMNSPISRSSSETIASVLLRTPSDSSRVRSYASCSSRFLVFAMHLAKLSNPTYELLVDFGLLDMILHVALGPNTQRPSHSTLDILTVCNSALRKACTTGTARSMERNKEALEAHPLSKLWPSYAPFFMRQSDEALRPRWERQGAWMALNDLEMLSGARLSSIETDWRLKTPQHDDDFAFANALDGCVDLLTLAGFKESDRRGIHPDVGRGRFETLDPTNALGLKISKPSDESLTNQARDDAKVVLTRCLYRSNAFRRAYDMCYFDIAGLLPYDRSLAIDVAVKVDPETNAREFIDLLADESPFSETMDRCPRCNDPKCGLACEVSFRGTVAQEARGWL